MFTAKSLTLRCFKLAPIGLLLLTQLMTARSETALAQTPLPFESNPAPQTQQSLSQMEQFLIDRREAPVNVTDSLRASSSDVRAIKSSGVLPAQHVRLSQADFFVYMPVIVRPLPSIFGVVTAAGVPVERIVLNLIQVDVPSNGVTGTVVATTTTNGVGRYAFSDIATLPAQKAYYVRFLREVNSGFYLDLFITRMLYTYSAGEDVALENFDIAEMKTNPTYGNRNEAELPATFTWEMRPYPTESYEFLIYNYGTGGLVISSVPVGHVNSYYLASLPPNYLSEILEWNIVLRTQLGGEGVNPCCSQSELVSSACLPPKLISPANGAIIRAPVELSILSQNPRETGNFTYYAWRYSSAPSIAQNYYASAFPGTEGGGTQDALSWPSFVTTIGNSLPPNTTYYWRFKQYCSTRQGVRASYGSETFSFTVVP